MKQVLLPKFLFCKLILCVFILFISKLLVAENKSDREEIIKLITLGIENWKEHSYDSAHIYLQTAEKRSIQIQDTQLIVVSLNNIGMLEISRANYKNSIECFQKSLKYNSNINSSKLNTFLNIGMTYRKMGDYESALSFLHKTKDTAESLGKNKELAICYTEFGIIKKLQKNYEEALSCYHKSLQIARALDYKKGIVGALNNIGNVYKEQKNFSKALLYFNETIDLKLELGDKKYLASAYINVGEVQMKLDDFINAENSLKKALNYSQDSKNKEQEITSCFLLGEMFIYKKNFLQSKLFLQRAHEKAELIGALDLQKEALLRLKNLYAAQNKGKEALAYYDKYISIKDSIFNSENTERMQRMDIQYKTREKEQQIEVLNIEKEAKAKESFYMKIVLGVFLFSLLPLGLFLRSHQKTRILKERVAASNRECTKLGMELHDSISGSLSYLCRSMERESVEESFVDQLRQVSDEVRGISHQLNMTAIANQEFRDALSDSLQLSNFPDNIDLKIYVPDGFEIDDYEKKINLIRIVQELVHNSLKHAQASSIVIKYKKESKRIQFEYADDGIGIDLDKIQKGNGWFNVKERAELLSGKVNLQSSPGNGLYFKLVI
ncbi:tetratricopeptide repeat protein [Marinifilum fragile]|uniref:tetratricopeptide repeat-containing sensor histidine kinase n=1 Tax=Marinifilum fragile TaxID=570161 RepID=UPI002AA82BA7|nr:tetratricopeptide repeat protein [Marinifilum fragile]